MSAWPSDHEIVVEVKPMGDVHLSDCDFNVNLFVYTNKKITIPKSECIKESNDSYIVTFNTQKLGRGNVMMSLELRIPNSRFDDGFKDINTKPICTGVADI